MERMKKFKKMNSKSGYSLGEVLVTVAIIVVLLALSIGSIFAIQRNLRQTELDQKAETIYTAAQNRLSALYANGLSDVYKTLSGGTLTEGKVGAIPSDATSSSITASTLSYVTHKDDGTGSPSLNSIIPSTVFDTDLYDESWVIEYNPKTGTVYGVFYSEDSSVDVASDYIVSMATGVLDTKYQETLRDKGERKSAGAKVGYYGGKGNSSSSDSATLKPTITVTNEETLKATVKCVRPKSSTGTDLVFNVTLADSKGNSVTKQYAYTGTPATNASVSKRNRTYTLDLTLDDLSEVGKRFYELYGEGSSNATKLESGTPLKLTVEVICPTDLNLYGKAVAETNSLFSDESTNTTAVVTYARHLQNLNLGTSSTDSTSSHVSDDIRNVQLMSNIYFSDDEDNANDWYSIYSKKFFNNKTSTGAPNFRSITNKNIEKFNGSYDDGTNTIQYRIIGLETESDTNSGLFASIVAGQELEVNNVLMSGTKVKTTGGAAGALIGSIESTGTSYGKVTIKGTQVYLSKAYGDLENMNESTRWIDANTTGGLVGTNAGVLSINESSASTILGNLTSGGLVGYNSGNLTIESSYADNYLFGKNVGGFVGSNNSGTVTIKGSYSAGYIGLVDNDSFGAGFVNGKVNELTNSYTIIAHYGIGDDNRLDLLNSEVGDYFSTCNEVTGTLKNVYYASPSNGDKAKTVAGTTGFVKYTPKSMNSKFDAGTFTIQTIPTQTYKLLDQSITSYTYPHIDGLVHYGDWQAAFQSGSLVYFEGYKDANGKVSYGFEGANVTSSLKNDETIIGDGYGIVFVDDTNSLPKSYTITLNGKETTVQLSDKPYYSVTSKDGKTKYRVYSLDLADLNGDLTTNFYQRIKVQVEATGTTSTSDEDDDALYFDFNPYFAKTVIEIAEEDNALSKLDVETNNTISIRTARQLYHLSKYDSFGADYLTDKKAIIYRQEANIDYTTYQWSTFYNSSVISIKEQKPIGTNSTLATGTQTKAFGNTYNGQCYKISGISFVTPTGSFDYIGMFGYNKGTIKNVVLSNDYTTTSSYYVKRGTALSGETAYFGVIAGYNAGSISNSAVAGYNLAGTKTLSLYSNSTAYIGSFTGGNEGTISNCSADNPKISVSTNYAKTYIGGFVGNNKGTVRNSYGLGKIEVVEAKGGTTVIAGFAARNSGSIANAYCATALTASGDSTTSVGFAPAGGSVTKSYYLNGGNYSYAGTLDNYDNAVGVGSPKTYDQLQDLVVDQATASYDHSKTNENAYPFNAYVKDKNGNFVHYGNWQNSPVLGSIGMFYWEHETGGSNNGYKLTSIGQAEGVTEIRSTLCNSHDDGGVISEYGYGYYVLDDGNNVTLNTNGISLSDGTINTTASKKFEDQIVGYKFYAFTTTTSTAKDYIKLANGHDQANGTVTLTYKNHSYEFAISPFFANALQMKGITGATYTDTSGKTSNYAAVPGTSANEYEIRSADQLQYINWNYGNNNTNTLISSSTYTKYNYLQYAGNTGTSTNPNTQGSVMYWTQSHDVDATNKGNFTPIAGCLNSSSETSYNAILYAWFGSEYNGQSYKIKNVSISSDSFNVGLFGTTVSANIRNVIMYSNNDSVIERKSGTTAKGAYSIGGLIGVAYDYNLANAKTIENCAIAGYKIKDNSTNVMGLGEVNVGGLIGVANVNLKNCSSSVEITENSKHSNGYSAYGVFIRIGGISGATQGIVENCYSGGKVIISDSTRTETLGNYNSYDKKFEIYVGGISGSGFTSNYTNFTNNSSVKDGSPKFYNCYTYMEFPKASNGDNISGMYAIGTVADRYGFTTASIDNCYVYAPRVTTNQIPTTIYHKGVATSDYRTTGSATTLTYKQMSFDELVDEGYFTKTDGTVLTAADIKNTANTGAIKAGRYNTTYRAVRNEYLIHNLTFVECLNTSGSRTETIWDTVSIYDASDASINGKYSFPGSNTALEGKNYPFPAVITQRDLTFGNDVHVHYGEWPLASIYWQKGRASVDIFDSMNEDEYTYITVRLMDDNGQITQTPTVDNFEFTRNGIVSIESITPNGSNYDVKFKVIKDGVTTVSYFNDQYEATFDLEVTADLTVKAEPSTFYMKPNDRSVSALSLLSNKNKEFKNNGNVTWTVTCDDDELDGYYTFKNDTKTIDVTGSGYEMVLDVTSTYNYHGVDFSNTVRVEVLPVPVVGIASGTTRNLYNEINLNNDREDDGSYKGVDLETPYEEAIMNYNNLYLYESNNAEVLEDATIETITVTDNNGTHEVVTAGEVVENSDYTVTFNDVQTTLDGIYLYRLGEIYYLGTDQTVQFDDVDVTVTLKKGRQVYTLSMDDVVAKRYNLKVVFDVNGGTISPADYQLEREVQFNENITLPDCEREGKVFAGWKAGNRIYDVNSVYTVKDDVTFVAQWGIKVTLHDGDTVVGDYVVEDNELSGYEEYEKENCTLDGWYDTNNQKAATVEGNIVEGYTIDQNIDLYGKFYATVTWRNDNVVLETDDNVEVGTMPSYDGEDPTKAEDVAYTYTFNGWDPTVGVVKGNTTYQAVFESTAKTFNITYELDGGTNHTHNPATYTTETETITLKDPTKDGFRFDGWFSDAEFTQQVKEIEKGSTGNITLYAQWTDRITFYLIDQGATPYQMMPNDIVVDAEVDGYTKPERQNGWQLQGWYTKDGKKVIDEDGTILLADKVVNNAAFYSKWERKVFVKTNEIVVGENYIFATEIGENTVMISNNKVDDQKANVSNDLVIDTYDDEGTTKDCIITTNSDSIWKAEEGQQNSYYQFINNRCYLENYCNNFIAVYREPYNSGSFYTDFGLNSEILISRYYNEKVYYNSNSNRFEALYYNQNNYKPVYLYHEIDVEENGNLAYTVKYVDEDGEEISDSKTVEAEEDSTIVADDEIIDIEGYTFKEHTGDITISPEVNEITITYKANPYKVHYEGNMGTGTMDDQSMIYGQTEALRENTFTRVGYTFAGWSKTVDGNVEFDDQKEVSNLTSTADEVVTLYAQWTANAYTIKYDANSDEAQGTTADSIHTYGVDKALTTNGYSITGYHFLGWAISEDGEVVYTNGQTVTNLSTVNNDTITLYAKWAANTYTVHYNANGGTGTVQDSSHTYGVSKVLNTNAFTRTGYTFDGWSTSVNGAKAYDDQEEVINLTEVNGDTVQLYARWTPITYTVTYHANGGTGTTADSEHTYDVAKNLTRNDFSRTGYHFDGWATSADGNVVYTNNESVTNLANTNGATVHLYAHWTINTYTVVYNANGGTGTMANSTYEYNESKALSTNTFTKTGYSFDGWATSVNGNVVYTDAQVISNLRTEHNASITLYAHWTANTYTVTYHANGGTGTTADSEHTYDVAKNLTRNGFSRTGYRFDGWATSADGNVVYTNRQSVTNLANTNGATVHLYAHWVRIWKVTLVNADGSTNVFDVDDGSTSLGDSYSDPTMTGWTFDGWFEQANLNTTNAKVSKGTNGSIATVNSDLTLYAKYETAGYTLTELTEFTDSIKFILGNNDLSKVISLSESNTLKVNETLNSYDGNSVDGTPTKVYVSDDTFGKSKWFVGTRRNGDNNISRYIRNSNSDTYYFNNTNALAITNFNGNNNNDYKVWRYNTTYGLCRTNVGRNQNTITRYYYYNTNNISDSDKYNSVNSTNRIYAYQISENTTTIYKYYTGTVSTYSEQSSNLVAKASKAKVVEKEEVVEQKTQLVSPEVKVDSENVYYGTDHNMTADPYKGTSSDERVSQSAVSFDVDQDASTYEITMIGAARESYDYLVGTYKTYDECKEAIKEYSTNDPNLYYDRENNLGEIKLLDSTLTWYVNRDKEFELYNVPVKKETSKELSQIIDYIYLEKDEAGYKVFVDSSDTRISLEQIRTYKSSNSVNSYYLGTLTEGSTMVLPFEEDIEMNDHSNHSAALLTLSNNKVELVMNEKKFGDYTSQISVQAKSNDSTMKDSEIVNIDARTVDTVKESEFAPEINSIDDIVSGNTIKMTSKYRMVLEITSKDSENRDVVTYVSSTGTEMNNVVTNEFTIPDELMTSKLNIRFAEIIEKQPKALGDELITNSLSTWSKSFTLDLSEVNEKQLTKTTLIYSGGNVLGYPTFDETIWITKNPYSNGNMGQCTWFAWARFYEIYGYSPSFTGNGYECVAQLVAAHPDQFEKSLTPVVGSVFSSDAAHNHVGIVVAVNGNEITVQEGNLDGVSNSWNEAKVDWQQVTYTLEALRGYYGKVTFANPKTVPTSAVTSATSAVGSRIGAGGLITYTTPTEDKKEEKKPAKETTTEEKPVVEDVVEPVTEPEQPTVPEQTEEDSAPDETVPEETQPSEEESENPSDELEEPEVQEETVSGWFKQDGKWYFIGEDGLLLVGEHVIDDVTYTFDETGALLSNIEIIEAQLGYLFQ